MSDPTPSGRAWAELRRMAGEATITEDGACQYALTHEDGWSRLHLLHVAVRRLNEAFANTGIEGGTGIPRTEEGVEHESSFNTGPMEEG